MQALTKAAAALGAIVCAQASAVMAYDGVVDPRSFQNKDIAGNIHGPILDPVVVGKVAVGLRKKEVYQLIGAPNLDGTYASHWRYKVRLRSGASGEPLSCRLLVIFAPEAPRGYTSKVTQIVWQSQTCVDRVVTAM